CKWDHEYAVTHPQPKIKNNIIHLVTFSLKNTLYEVNDVAKSKIRLTGGVKGYQKSRRNDDFSYKVRLPSQTLKRCFDKLTPNF
ncbi:hypothetical protein, partial [Kluyvera sp. Awk 3]|uniref:hypothetical protein n=1 Tax=Kluyvera sp. Awk 3 TaxID=2963956 RepID=UPI00230215BA